MQAAPQLQQLDVGMLLDEPRQLHALAAWLQQYGRGVRSLSLGQGWKHEGADAEDAWQDAMQAFAAAIVPV
jgi:hypothetical protein